MSLVTSPAARRGALTAAPIAAATAAAATVAPTALLVGPMKAGTSWLYEVLKRHRDVALPDGVKETFYFDRRFERKSPEWYLAHFCPAAAARSQQVVEVAPTYFHHPQVPRRVVETLGAIPVVVTLRDPAARAFSLFQHLRRYGYPACHTFRSAVEHHPEIVQSSRYFEGIERWRAAVGQDNVHVLVMDDLHEAPEAFAAGCCDALGIDSRIDPNGLPGPVNVACQPRSRLLARAGRAAADALRSRRFYGIVEHAKRWGMKPWFFGRPTDVRESITDRDRRWFLSLIEDDLRRFRSYLERDVSHWYESPRPNRAQVVDVSYQHLV